MLEQTEIARLLKLHDAAYGLLMFLTKAAKHQPAILSADVVQMLSKGETCESWIRANTELIPAEFYPVDDDLSAFSHLFASFFSTSFHVDGFTFNNQLLGVNVRTGAQRTQGKPTRTRQLKTLALKHLMASEGVRLTDAECRQLIKNPEIKQPILIWTYVWELDRRVKGKGKGAVVHSLWRSMPHGMRQNLNTETVWNARQSLVAQVRLQDLYER